jgi:hypothetical protein
MLAIRGTDRQLHDGAGLLVLALILFALTDNPTASPTGYGTSVTERRK